MSKVLDVGERAAVPYHRWSVEEFHRMAGSGLLAESDRVELIHGALVDMAPIGSRHTFQPRSPPPSRLPDRRLCAAGCN